MDEAGSDLPHLTACAAVLPSKGGDGGWLSAWRSGSSKTFRQTAIFRQTANSVALRNTVPKRQIMPKRHGCQWRKAPSLSRSLSLTDTGRGVGRGITMSKTVRRGEYAGRREGGDEGRQTHPYSPPFSRHPRARRCRDPRIGRGVERPVRPRLSGGRSGPRVKPEGDEKKGRDGAQLPLRSGEEGRGTRAIDSDRPWL